MTRRRSVLRAASGVPDGAPRGFRGPSRGFRGASGGLIRTGGTVLVLALLVRGVDVREVARHLEGVHTGWVLAALLLSVAQMLLSSWRWRFTAESLGVSLPFREALREYYLASFLNQILPGGVLGDATRAWRQGRSASHAHPRAAGERRFAGEPSPARERRTAREPHAHPPRPARISPVGPAVRSVVLERASGQMVMLAVAALSVATLPLAAAISPVLQSLAAWIPRGDAGRGGILGLGPWLFGVGLTGLFGFGLTGLFGVGAVTRTVRGRRGPVAALARRFGREARIALLSRGTLPVQLATSLLVVASYVLVYLAAARAVGVETPAQVLAPLVPPVLVAMLIPLSLAGWGLREGAAAVVWSTVGLPASEGVAISVTYGLLVLVSSLPGGLIFLGAFKGGRSDPGRRGDPARDGSDDTAGGGPGRASPPAPG